MSDCSARGVRNTIPAVRLLGNRTHFIVVSIEWRECRQLHPAVAQLLICIAIETTRVRPNEGDLEDLKLKDALNTEVHIPPFAEVVA